MTGGLVTENTATATNGGGVHFNGGTFESGVGTPIPPKGTIPGAIEINITNDVMGTYTLIII